MRRRVTLLAILAFNAAFVATAVSTPTSDAVTIAFVDDGDGTADVPTQ